MERNIRNDVMALSYLLGVVASELHTENIAFPELALHGLEVCREHLERLSQEVRNGR